VTCTKLHGKEEREKEKRRREGERRGEKEGPDKLVYIKINYDPQ
jgi:hypothetical protein